MAKHAPTDYLVVKMCDPITKKGMGFKCIPASWIQNTLIDNYLITRYPLEQNSETELQVKHRQAASANWPFYCATIVSRADVYEKAIEFITNKEKNEPLGTADKQQDNMNEQSNAIENQTPTATKRKSTEENDNETTNENSLPKKPRKPASNSKKTVKEKPVSATKRKESPEIGLSLREGARTRTLETLIASGEFNTIEKLYNTINSPSKSDPPNEVESNDALTIDVSDSSDCESLPSSPAKNNPELEIEPKTLEAEAEEPSIIGVHSILENLLTSPPKAKKTSSYKPNKLNLKQLENIYNTILEVKSKLKAAYEEANLTLKKCFEGTDINVPDLNYISTLTTENIQPTSAIKLPSPVPTVGSPKGQLLSPKRPEISRLETTQIKGPMPTEGPILSEEPTLLEEPPTPEGPTTPEIPSKTSSTKQTSDTKWTLRHQGPGIGLIELMPFSRVYVSQAELHNCQALVSDVKKFARALLPIIFTKEALRTCTYTGNKPKSKCPESFEVRPGLDENARNTLLTYVMKYGSDSGWATVSPEVIVTTLKNKLQIQKYRCNIK